MIDPLLKQQFESLVNQVDTKSVPCGMLTWWGSEALPDGKKSIPELSQLGWSACYSLLVNGALVSGQIKGLPALKAPLRQLPQDGPIPLSIARFRYARPRKKFAAAFSDAAQKGTHLQDPPEKLQDAITERTAFMVTCLLPEQWAKPESQVRARNFQLEIDRAFYLATPGSPQPDEIRVDTGSGEIAVNFGDRVSCSVPAGDSLSVVVRARYAQEWLEARCIVGVSDQAPAPRPDESWPLWVPGGLTGSASVYRAAHADAARRYVIMAEGFPGGYPAAYLYDNLNQFGLFESIRKLGYDIITIGFDQGAQTIQRNAEVVIECIKKANATGTGHMVGGVSMGGLTTRYALATMEQRGIAHNTSIYLSIDSPHQGSRTSVANQWFAHYFEKVVPGMSDLVALLDSPANQQFLPQWYHAGEVSESDLRKQLYADYKSLGDYPQQPKRYAVASGRGDGKASMSPLSPMISWKGSALAAASLHTLPSTEGHEVIAQGEWFSVKDEEPAEFAMSCDVSWEGVAGSVNNYNDLIKGATTLLGIGEVEACVNTACTVPTVSALDLDQDPRAAIPVPTSDKSPFDDYICANENLPHIAISQEIRDWILEKLQAHMDCRIAE